jgi:hypothetical protein
LRGRNLAGSAQFALSLGDRIQHTLFGFGGRLAEGEQTVFEDEQAPGIGLLGDQLVGLFRAMARSVPKIARQSFSPLG